MVRKEGVEPSRVTPYASETYAYASSATSAVSPPKYYPTKSPLSIRNILCYNNYYDIIILLYLDFSGNAADVSSGNSGIYSGAQEGAFA